MNANANPQPEEPRAAARAGHVALVGSGPGGADLLTLRGAELLSHADVVITLREPAAEELSGFRAELLSHCSEDVSVIEAGECGGDVNALAVARARDGQRVVRLYSGDPFFGCRGAELVSACHEAGVEVEVAPGVSAITSVPTFAGVPLLDADSPEVRVLNARAHGGGGVDWHEAAASGATLVVMGGDAPAGEPVEHQGPGFDVLCKTLIAGGRPASTPVAVVRAGGTTRQTTVSSTLGRLVADLKSKDAKGHHVTAPALMVVGPAAGRHPELSWYESRPLFGWRVLVPRTKEQAAALSDQLRGYGAVPEEVPTISVEPPRTPQQMERAVRGLVTGRYQWVAFTSVNAVRAIRERLESYGLDARAFAGVKVAVVGEATARAVREFGIQPDLAPPEEEQSSSGLVSVWPPYDAEIDPIERVLLPRADIATETLSAGLDKLGWEVDDVTAYRTVRAAPPPAPVREAIKGGGFDAVLFTSSSTVRNLVGIAGKPHNTTVIAVIGPETERTAIEFGLRVDVVAPKASVSALAQALSEYGAEKRREAVEAGKPVLKPSQKRRGRRRKL
ncbi:MULTISPECIES: uroporphyrinogen-III synthase [Nocardiopsis]|uniref:uroporphyrinogen-III C-methyltransferase n=1 Tax=Nocardiopsis dassonvillei (strain ATCC 23218 / DSM 43111 / CIP 107115 / JCM 7437 / KCTC 9190 / NBRC 14626 / NCTC 10488 / NRRL B-5397 / IMRU 509) TaxID=446468 RepID=D7AWY9_NOCDD|nr:bifunctional uroporphyrinogen-III C-methyltransferase/uroporphyrinogen-III synthase [Nocardiopsis dassonvillei]ADH69759.1 Uroporphyrin-III C/tetrapyrrole (Corrin/Porphyrin) methyltransferase [Nocardiopsis dassonvillei subsp. dassonvillei DSM 43111]APC37761.1 bifunctional uroporphyrinogen-III C-methyltransferase/uroporphyrinogen-III synthase [Nocardiopsis dassonvillei]NKY77750.1 bifunctional uroporphyrinogen-III C-methyltransferase/uroporphyrinogen-III synthase [Nocardiopsis dassonvillei]VEI9